MLLKDKIAIVTGGGVGIGKAIALRYAREGAHVVVAEINEATGRQTAAEVSAQNRRGLFVKTDMSNLSEINAVVAKTVATFGRIDVLMNNAGVNKKLDFFEVTERDWDWIHSINAKGLFFCMQAAAREMARSNYGKIVNLASIGGKGFRGTSNVAYAGSKGAVITMTRIAASQLPRTTSTSTRSVPARHARRCTTRSCARWPSATESLTRKRSLVSMRPFPCGARTPGTTSPTWRPFWPRTNHGTSPANR